MRHARMSIVLASLVIINPSNAQEAVQQPRAEHLALCSACHGVAGNSQIPTIPSLAGQGERYLLRQLKAIQSGSPSQTGSTIGRSLPEMTGLLSPITDADLAALAAYYAHQKPSLSGEADPTSNHAAGAQLYHGGRTSAAIPACSACHAPDGSGNTLAAYPRVAGLSARYLSAQLNAYREGRRTTDGNTHTMRQIAEKLSPADIDALAQYIQNLR